MELVLSNAHGDSLNLGENPYFFLTNVDGQTRANANLSTITLAGVDGDDVNNAQAQPRTIILDFRIKSGVDVETAKRAILKVAKIKQTATLTWTQNLRVVEISGVVESVEMPRWTNAVVMQLTLHCDQPFWEDIDENVVEINDVIAIHYFSTYPNDQLIFTSAGQPFGEIDTTRTRSFYNNGDTSVGMDIEIIAFDTVTNPIITNAAGEFFGVGHGTGTKQVVMAAGDIIKISTHKGNKSVKLNGTSVIAKVKPNSTWLQLHAGHNTLNINSDEAATDNVTFNLIYRQRYV